MQQSRFMGVIIAFVVVCLGLWLSYFIVYPRQQVAIKRFGQLVRVEPSPGLYFKIPFLDQTVIVDDRLRRYDLPTQTVQVKGGLNYEVDAFFVYQITDAKLFLRSVSDGRTSTVENQHLVPRFVSALRAVYGVRDFGVALSDERSEMMRDVQQQFASPAKALGITIVDVRIRKTDLTQEVSQGTFARMRQERETVAETTRAHGNAERIRIRAEADRGYEEMVAAATRDSDILRGEGEAERAKIINEAIAVDPDFYSFWLSMGAYNGIKDMPMVITPDMPFFEYMNTPGKKGVIPPMPKPAN